MQRVDYKQKYMKYKKKYLQQKQIDLSGGVTMHNGTHFIFFNSAVFETIHPKDKLKYASKTFGDKVDSWFNIKSLFEGVALEFDNVNVDDKTLYNINNTSFGKFILRKFSGMVPGPDGKPFTKEQIEDKIKVLEKTYKLTDKEFENVSFTPQEIEMLKKGISKKEQFDADAIKQKLKLILKGIGKIAEVGTGLSIPDSVLAVNINRFSSNTLIAFEFGMMTSDTIKKFNENFNKNKDKIMGLAKNINIDKKTLNEEISKATATDEEKLKIVQKGGECGDDDFACMIVMMLVFIVFLPFSIAVVASGPGH